jgi:hypothetical protein
MFCQHTHEGTGDGFPLCSRMLTTLVGNNSRRPMPQGAPTLKVRASGESWASLRLGL